MRQNYDSNVAARSLRTRYNQNNEDKESYMCFFTDFTDPQTAEEALSSRQATEWKTAMDEEYKSLIKNKNGVAFQGRVLEYSGTQPF